MPDPSSFPVSACSSGKLPVARCVAPEFREGRKTVAVLIDFIDQTTDGYESALRAGFEAQCRNRDLNLLVVVGRALQEMHPSSAHHNDVFQLVAPDCVDGLILISPGLGCHIGPTHFARWCESFGPLPVCSIGTEVPGLPSIIADNRAGMSAVVEHIVAYHQCKRIAYLTCDGNPDAIERLDACRRVMAKQGLPLDPSLVVHASFEMSMAEQAIMTLLDKGAKFDAVIAANDGIEPAPVSRGRAKVLAVDDDPIQLRVAQRVLSRLGYEVTTLASGAQAYRLLCVDKKQPGAVAELRERWGELTAPPRPICSGCPTLLA